MIWRKINLKASQCYQYFKKVKYSERNMTYGTSHLLIGGGGVFSGGGSRKNIAV